MVITTAQLHSTKPEIRLCASSNPVCGMSEICNGEDLWQWSLLEKKAESYSPFNNATKTIHHHHHHHFSSVSSAIYILSAKTFGIDILQFIKYPTKSVSCQSQIENHISHSSTIDQSNQIHSSSDQILVSSTNQNANQPLSLGTNISHKENPLSPEESSYQTQTIYRQTSKTLTQA